MQGTESLKIFLEKEEEIWYSHKLLDFKLCLSSYSIQNSVVLSKGQTYGLMKKKCPHQTPNYSQLLFDKVAEAV